MTNENRKLEKLVTGLYVAVEYSPDVVRSFLSGNGFNRKLKSDSLQSLEKSINSSFKQHLAEKYVDWYVERVMQSFSDFDVYTRGRGVFGLTNKENPPSNGRVFYFTHDDSIEANEKFETALERCSYLEDKYVFLNKAIDKFAFNSFPLQILIVLAYPYFVSLSLSKDPPHNQTIVRLNEAAFMLLMIYGIAKNVKKSVTPVSDHKNGILIDRDAIRYLVNS
jgi:hypothetical protein